MLRRVGLLEKIVMNFKFAVIGGGAWGTAIANSLARLNNGNVIIWAKEKEVVYEINSQHKNSLFLEGIELEKNIYATDNISEIESDNENKEVKVKIRVKKTEE